MATGPGDSIRTVAPYGQSFAIGGLTALMARKMSGPFTLFCAIALRTCGAPRTLHCETFVDADEWQSEVLVFVADGSHHRARARPIGTVDKDPRTRSRVGHALSLSVPQVSAQASGA